MRRRKTRLLGRQVWCTGCTTKTPPKIRKSDVLVPVRRKPYDLGPDLLNIDMRVVGVCNECLDDKNKFQRSNTEEVSLDHKHLVYIVL